MKQEKKLQIFISSTFKDLKKHRKAVMETILRSGHTPLGMEFFCAEDEAQFEIIKTWIDDADVFLLIIGKSYGSYEDKKGVSFVEKEYEYAVSKGMHILVFIENSKRKSLENETRQKKLERFKKRLGKAKRMNQYFQNIAELKEGVSNSIKKFCNTNQYRGWIRGEELVSPADQYLIHKQEICFLYQNMNSVIIEKRFTIQPFVKDFQYFTDRISWKHKGKVSISCEKDSGILVDKYDFENYTYYTIRLNESVPYKSTVTVSVRVLIEDADNSEPSFLSLNIINPCLKAKLSVNSNGIVNIASASYEVYEHSVDRTPKAFKIKTDNEIISQTIDKPQPGSKHCLKWRF